MNDVELYQEIDKLIDSHIRPILVSDGGDIELLEVVEKRVVVQFSGACGSCPSSAGGTLRGIQKAVETIDPELVIIPVEPEISGPATGQVHPFGGETYADTIKRKENM